jgi:lysophospholipase L1-like esterase
MKRTLALLLALLLALGLAGAAQAHQGQGPSTSQATTSVSPVQAQSTPLKHAFIGEIDSYLTEDHALAPARCANLFVGSSTIRRWNSLTADMRPLPVINRGFGGSQIDDINYYFDQVVTPYHPRAIVFYAGDNDIHAGKSPEQVFGDFQTFMRLKDERLGATPVYVVSVKPSASRAGELARQAELNARLKRLADRRPDLVYLDIVPAMLGPGHTTKDIYFGDGLHMRSAGYAYWIPVVKAALERPAPTRAPGC